MGSSRGAEVSILQKYMPAHSVITPAIIKKILGVIEGVFPVSITYEIKTVGAAQKSKNIKGASKTPIPRILIVARANSR